MLIKAFCKVGIILGTLHLVITIDLVCTILVIDFNLHLLVYWHVTELALFITNLLVQFIGIHIFVRWS